MNFPWNAKSIQRLRELAPHMGPADIAPILSKEFDCPIHRDAVGGKGRRLGLRWTIKTDSPWTDERIELAKKMWAEGASAGRIAKALACGISRNAVISKMYRSEVEVRPKAQPQLPKRERPKKTAVEAGMASVAARKVNEARKASKPGILASSPPEVLPKTVLGGGGAWALDPGKWDARPLPSSKPALLVDLEGDQCRWPLGEKDGIRGRHLMCGAKKMDGCAYCGAHAFRAAA